MTNLRLVWTSKARPLIRPLGDIERLCQVQAKKRRLQSQYDQSPNAKVKKKKKHKMRKIAEKVERIMQDADYKTIKMILDKADVVLIPKFDSSTRKKGGFNNKVRVDSSLYAHCRFVERLKMKARSRGKTVVEVIEPYTSKTCTRCLSLKNDLGSAKVFRCRFCGFVGHRDVCGARNILILNRDLFTLRVRSDRRVVPPKRSILDDDSFMNLT